MADIVDDPLIQILDLAASLENNRASNDAAPGEGAASTSTASDSITSRIASVFPAARVRGFNFPLLRRQYTDLMKWRTWFDVIRDRAWRERQKSGKAAGDNECPICLESMEGMVKLQPITCKHVFHEHVSFFFLLLFK
jgi:hypothetical protein